MRHLFRLLLAATIATPVVLVLAKARAPGPEPALEDLGPAPEFALVERGGRPLTRADLAGKVWIADFIFTRCAGPCPIMTAAMREVARELGAEEDVRLVSFTLDPEHDTPEVLSRYARAAGADEERWLFATGAPDALRKLSIEGFKLGAGRAPPAEGETEGVPVHSTRFVLVDRAGRIRGYYDGTGETDPGARARLVAHARRLLAEGARP